MESVVGNQYALAFMLAGKSEFTMLSIKTNAHISYKVTRVESNKNMGEFIYFVAVVKQESEFVGTIFFTNKDGFVFRQGNKGKYSANSKEIVSLLYVMNAFHRGKTKLDLEVYHCGKCGRCGRKLTTPESIITGVGPECAKKIGIPHPSNRM